MLYWLRITVAAGLSAAARLLARAVVFMTAFAVVVAALVVGASLLARPLVSAREGRLDQRWGTTLAPLLSLPDRVVPHAANPAAVDLEAAAAELGIELAPRGVAERVRPQAAAATRWAASAGGFADFAETLVRGAGSLPSLNVDIELFLSKQQRAVERVIAVIDRGVPPRWECDFGRGRDAPRPSETGLRDLQRLLAAEAVSRWHRGELEDAGRVLAAAWRLNRSALERPEMSAFIAAQQTLAVQLAVLRGMDPPPAGWLDRLVALDLELRFRQLVQAESWLTMEAIGRGVGIDRAEGWARFLRGPIARPFRRLAALDHAEAMRWAVEQLPQRSMSPFERGRFDAELKEAVPRWNTLARSELSGMGAAWQQTEHGVAGLELAEVILAVHELDGAGDRQLLDQMAGARWSRIHGMEWLITVEADRLTVALDGEPYPRPHRGFVELPLRATVMLSVPPLSKGTPDAAS